uniref:KOW domain-containing protein n=1 Tax=Gongylonema pulchrum TaxID=637853 RepID=A0A183CX59_9BILA
LETVVPKVKGEKLMVVLGPHRGTTAVLEARDRKNNKVFVRLIATDEVLSASFDDVCEYLGSDDD